MRFKNLRSQIAVFTILSLMVASCSDYTNSSQKPGAEQSQNQPQLPKPGTGEGYGDPNSGPFTEEKMLINIGINVMARSAAEFATQVPVLKNSLRQYCEALSNGPARREEAQVKADWERTMFAYHEMEAAPMALKDRGEYLSSHLYFWPYLNTCDIDNTVLENSSSPMDASRTLPNRKGLAALEYLLFEDSLTSSCNLRAHPHMQEWNARPAQQKKLERCLWAQELMKDVDDKANELKVKWDIEKENFTRKLAHHPDGVKEAVNALTDSLAQIEILKDAKLGVPLARHKDCAMEKCPQQIEHKYSGASLASAEAQLRGFRAIFTGSFANSSDAFGLDDFLVKAGRQDVANNLLNAIDRAMASVQNAQTLGTFLEQVEAADPALCKASTMTDRKVEICAVHADVRDVAFILKTEVLAALALRAPPTHQGDND